MANVTSSFNFLGRPRMWVGRRMDQANIGTVPLSVRYAIIGAAAIHGSSTGFHLAQMPKKSGRGSGEDILVVDKTASAAGASGIVRGWDDLNWLEDAHTGYETGEPAIFDRNINGWVRIPDNQQDRECWRGNGWCGSRLRRNIPWCS